MIRGEFAREAVGWASSAILLATLSRQVYVQWKTRSIGGLSKWLFIGQVTASIGFTAYSLLLRNWVFTASNIAILGVAIVGETLYVRNRRRNKSSLPEGAKAGSSK